MFLKRTAVAAVCVSMLFAMTAFASEVKGRANGFAEEQKRFPFEIELDSETCERKCYAGYGKKYQMGYGITPYSEFQIRATDPTADAAALKIDIAVVYQNEGGNGSKKEMIKTYDYGDLTAGDGSSYAFFSDSSIESLEESGRLYSDSTRSLCMTLSYDGDRKKSEKRYYQVFTDEDLMYYIENQEAAEAEETVPAAEVIYSENAEVITE